MKPQAPSVATTLQAIISAGDSAPGSPAPVLTEALTGELWAVAEALPFGVVVLDSLGRVVVHNAAAARFWGPGPRTVIGQNLFGEALSLPDPGDIEQRYLGPGGESDAYIDVEVVLPGKRPVRLQVHSIALTDGGNSVGVAILEDLGPLREERRRRERAERMASIGELAATVVHEVNNPLTAIKGFAQLLSRDASDPALRAGLDVINRESTRAAAIIRRHLSLVREPQLRSREPVNLNQLVEEILELYGYSLGAAGIMIRNDLDPLLPEIPGDPDGLRQIVLNLIINAEQALASEQTREPRLIVRSRITGDGVVLSVVDNGPGIPPDVLSSVFEPGRTTKSAGTGLGLAISNAIAREHGGEMRIESKKGAGTSVGLHLPRTGFVLPDPEAEGEPAMSEAPARRLRVLVADDEPTIRLAVRLALEDRGHEVTEAPDAHKALELAEREAFDVALVDVQMPGDGLSLLARLDEGNALHGKAILLTGDVYRRRTQQALESGTPHLTKPFNFVDVVELVERTAGA